MVKAKTLESFLYFVAERENIRARKEDLKLPAPWTDDPILQKYRFCNVRRKDDRVSKWIIQHVLRPFRDATDLWHLVCVARYLNWPPTLERILSLRLMSGNADEFQWEQVGNCVDDIVMSGQKAYTGAYMIPARPPKGEGKGHWIARLVLDPLRNVAIPARAAIANGSLQELARVLEGSFGMGSFMSGQVVADLSYVLPFKDSLTWAPIGPGSTRGLNRLCDRPLNQAAKGETFIEELIVVNEIIKSELGIMDLTLHDCQSLMCETDKYFRIIEGGRVRANYSPETRFFI